MSYMISKSHYSSDEKASFTRPIFEQFRVKQCRIGRRKSRNHRRWMSEEHFDTHTYIYCWITWSGEANSSVESWPTFWFETKGDLNTWVLLSVDFTPPSTWFNSRRTPQAYLLSFKSNQIFPPPPVYVRVCTITAQPTSVRYFRHYDVNT